MGEIIENLTSLKTNGYSHPISPIMKVNPKEIFQTENLPPPVRRPYPPGCKLYGLEAGSETRPSFCKEGEKQISTLCYCSHGS